ncbi:MAG: hypothetical protein IJF56_09300 [Clostridia bacterium]|nr:hypothetical protein [Clostridia bacterium]
MCWILYGCVNKGTNESALEALNKQYDFFFSIGTAHQIKTAVREMTYECRVTDWACDCNSSVGRGDTETEDIEKLSCYLWDLQEVEGFEQISLAKCWRDKCKGGTKSLKVCTRDIPQMLADLEENMVHIISIKSA